MRQIKMLANVNIEKGIIDFLQSKGIDIKWVAEINKRMADEQVIKIANDEQRIIITNDKDFGEIVFFQKKISCGIILLRVWGQNSQEKIRLLDKLLSDHQEKIMLHFVVVNKSKFRFIPLEVR